MKFPDTLSVAVLMQGTNEPVSQVAVVLEIFAARKNDYIVGPLMSDELGRVEFTRAACEASIATHQKMFVMDYVG
jgi:hypothetical protein